MYLYQGAISKVSRKSSILPASTLERSRKCVDLEAHSSVPAPWIASGIGQAHPGSSMSSSRISLAADDGVEWSRSS